MLSQCWLYTSTSHLYSWWHTVKSLWNSIHNLMWGINMLQKNEIYFWECLVFMIQSRYLDVDKLPQYFSLLQYITWAWWNVFTQLWALLLFAQRRTTWSGSHALYSNPSGRRKTKQTRERTVTACGLHWKEDPIISNRGTYTRSETKRGVCTGVLKVSRAVVLFFWGWGRCCACVDLCSLRGRGLALALAVGCCVSTGTRKGARTEAILTESCGWKGNEINRFRI